MQLDPIGQLRLEIILGVLALFTLTLALLRRTFFLPVIAVLERRQERLAEADAVREEAAALLRDADEEAARIGAEAQAEADARLAKARAHAESARRERLDAARAEAQTRLDGGRAALRTEREAELSALSNEASACITLACGRLLDHVDERAVGRVVERLVARTVT
jgi:F0F1-type ATP synthase membrane subunit b/b'